ncbi:hypothetical protein HUT19_15215 [Streptomyces sp. NA02950]|uniref:hypothetical protein n=1 Tax=Streptomyces sp. NA02950 TaxID=2742137 RepID=UPI0015905E58|nr:hypothetical protein [Streptomyces sp. NA02950]QKV92939.1 hypothetical protein HUT19_15215 [Streptomyces sp. NA02950]
MNANILTTIVNDLTATGWHALDSRETDKTAPIVKALQRHRVRANDSAVLAVRHALWERRQELKAEPAAPAVDDLGLPVPTAEELADEAAYVVDVFFMLSLTFAPDAPWVFDNDDVNCSAVPRDIRQTAFRAGMTVAAAHGVPDHPPTMRQVVNALIKRMNQDGRIGR